MDRGVRLRTSPPLLALASWVAIVACISVPATPACAQEDPASASGAVVESLEYADEIDDAVNAYRSRSYSAALASFQRAHALSPSARTLRGMGLALYYLQDFPAAHVAIEAALSSQIRPLAPEQRRELASLLPTIQQATAQLSVFTEPANAQVLVDGTARAVGMTTLWPGRHVLRVEAEGRLPEERILELQAGEARAVQVGLLLAAPPSATGPGVAVERTAPSVAAPLAVPEAASDSRLGRPARHRWTRGLLGASAALFGGGGAVWLVGKRRRDAIQEDCRTEGCTRGALDAAEQHAHLTAFETTTTIALSAAVSALLGSGVAYWVERRRPSVHADTLATPSEP